ncbi:hypothetical protein SAMN05192562_1109 [Kosakonia arachidis]|uniref:Apea-like HEPN domain-containing protein n=1 Tax=Kosakonia arachidis TaxID=551989 RepID=A0A1I7E4W8_9ENTR|nr:HEPN domain-containing protein [Kosakonia arachidis]SFU18974.1 hypothetical protein SAMN05192562_1109 [Kosakonia arachidis]
MKFERFDFFESYSFLVSFSIKEIKCIGKLIVGVNGLPLLQIESSPNNIEYSERVDLESEITCCEIGGTNTFILNECEYVSGVIYPKWIAKGKVFFNSNKLEIHLTGVSEWLERERGFYYEGEKLIRDGYTERFKVNFSYKEKRYIIENVNDLDLKANTPTNHTINVEHSIFITKEDGFFLLDDIKEIVREVRSLFSILLGVPLTVRFLYLVSKESNAKYNSIYIPQFNFSERPLSYSHEAFCSFNFIVSEGLFPVIIKNFFSKKTFRTIWSRLITILNGNKSWEMDILTHVVTLEKYCSMKSKGKGHKLNIDVFNNFRNTLIKSIDGFVSDTELSPEDVDLITGIRGEVSRLKNTTHAILKDKYDYVMSGVTNEIKDAISFSDDDFDIIRNIRNSVAHGNEYKTFEAGDITREMDVKSRLLLLLMYLAFRDLGFNDEQFALCVSRTHSPILRRASINERAIDFLSKEAEFITLSQSYKEGYKSYKPIVIKYDSINNSYIVDDEISTLIKNNWPNKSHPDIRDFVRLMLPVEAQIKYLNKVYVSYGGKEVLYFGAILVR